MLVPSVAEAMLRVVCRSATTASEPLAQSAENHSTNGQADETSGRTRSRNRACRRRPKPAGCARPPTARPSAPPTAPAIGAHAGAATRTRATQFLHQLPSDSIDPESSRLAIDVDIKSGTIAALADAGIAVQTDVARDHNWAVGDSINVTFPTGDQTLRLAATYSRNTLVGDYLVDLSTFDRGYVGSNDFALQVRVPNSSDVRSAQTEIKQIVDERYPGLNVQDREEYVAAMKAQVKQFTSLITALLVLAIAIALLVC